MSEKSDTTMEMTETPEAKSLNPDDVDVKQDKKSNLNYFLGLLSDSVVTGVPQIVTVSNLIRKVFKILVLGACIGGFIYQAVEFMKLYNTYPFSLEVEVKYSKELPAPSVTICNRNPVQKVPFCKEKKELCAKPTNLERFCKLYPSHCNENTTIDDLEFVISNAYIEKEDVEKFSEVAEDLIAECCCSFIPVENDCRHSSKKLIYMDENNIAQTCYVIDFATLPVNSSYSSFQEMIEKSVEHCLWWSPFDLEQTYSIMTYLDSKELARPDVKPSVQVAVHSANSLKNPFQQGFAMEEGKQYTVKMRAFEENLLPAPYSTNCVDAKELEENYNRESCIKQCAVQFFADKCGCMPLVFLSDDVPECDDDIVKLQCIQSFANSESCYNQCPRLCHFYYFEYEVSSSNFEDTVKSVDLGDGPVVNNDLNNETTAYVKQRNKLDRKGKAFLRILYSKQEITVYNYKPKYEKIEILGYIGGFSGIWLGVSLVAVFDFFETIIVFIGYLIKRSRNKKDYSIK